jgi:hypothetical protein
MKPVRRNVTGSELCPVADFNIRIAKRCSSSAAVLALDFFFFFAVAATRCWIVKLLTHLLPLL